MDLRVRETGEQLLWLRVRQRDGAATELPDHQTQYVSPRGPSSRPSGIRSAIPNSVRKGDGGQPGETACLSSVVDCQRLGHELWVAERASGGGAQSWQPDLRLPSEHGRRGRLVAPPPGRRSGVASRDGVLWLSRT